MITRFLGKLFFLGAIVCTPLTQSVLAYEVSTHEDMSEQAALMSSLNGYLPTIGLKSLDEELTDINTKQSIVKWIRKGANDEDDTISTNFARYRNHFYDPQHGGAGYSYGLFTGEPSPDWALEDTRAFVTQSYSLKDARQYFYDALTLPNKDNREMWMARTFYTVGHVVHHIQDMAQPQHTRNDSHGGFFLGPKSRYEIYTNEHRNELSFSDANYNQNSPVIFDKARSFWDTGDGRGMTEFSSLNFVSAGTNFDTDRYPSPKLIEATPHAENANALLQSAGITPPPECLPPNAPCVMTFYSSQVKDNYRSAASAENPRTSTSSIFDQDLQANNLSPAFSLNRFNFDAAHQFLIPRAVAYSAGLINYFFRGRLDAHYVNYSPQDKLQAAMLIRNNGTLPLTGTFSLYYDKEDDTRVFLANVTGTLQPAPTDGSKPQELVLQFMPPPILGQQEKPYTVVFKGTDGNEELATGVKVKGAVLAFQGASGLENIDPKWAGVVTEASKLVHPYDGPFVGSRRVRPNPADANYALVYHPLTRQVGVVDYAANKTVPVQPAAGLLYNAVLAANWLGPQQIVVAQFFTRRTANSWPFFPTATVSFAIYNWDSASSKITLSSRRDVQIQLNGVFPSAAMQLDWADPPWPLTGSWWTIDVDQNGEAVTVMDKMTITTQDPVYTYTSVTNCNNPVATSINEGLRRQIDFFLLRIKPDGTLALGDSVASTVDTTTAWRYFDPPPPPPQPQSTCDGSLTRQTVERTVKGIELAHADITPTGALAFVMHQLSTDFNAISAFDGSAWHGDSSFTVNESWTANGRTIATGSTNDHNAADFTFQSDSAGFLVASIIDSSYIIDEGGIEIYDVGYDGNDNPWVLWVDDHRHGSGTDNAGDTLVDDTTFYFGNDQTKSTVLQATISFGDKFGPPIYPADVIANPYGPGAVTVFQILGPPPFSVASWYAPPPRNYFVNYIDPGRQVDLFMANPQEFNQAVQFQFLP